MHKTLKHKYNISLFQTRGPYRRDHRHKSPNVSTTIAIASVASF